MAYTATKYMFTNTLFQYHINDWSGVDTDTTIDFRRIPNRTLTINPSDFQQNFVVIELWIIITICSVMAKVRTVPQIIFKVHLFLFENRHGFYANTKNV